METFGLSIIMLISVILCLSTGVTYWCGMAGINNRLAIIYGTIVYTIFQCINLLSLYAPAGLIPLTGLLKNYFLLLQPPIYLFCLFMFVDKGKYARQAFVLHVLLIAFMSVLLFLTRFQKQEHTSLIGVVRSGNFMEIYIGAFGILLSVICSIYIFLDRTLRRYLPAWLVALSLPALFLFIGQAAAGSYIDTAKWKVQMLLCVTQLVFSLLIFPLLYKRNTHLPAFEIIKDSDETVIVFNQRGQVEYIHDGFCSLDTSGYIENIKELLAKGLLAKDTPAYCEGEMELMTGKVHSIHYKLTRIYSGSPHDGVIAILRDITEQKELIQKLNVKNLELRRAFDVQKKYVHVERQLAAEEERLKVLQTVNRTAGEYLDDIRERIGILEHFDSAGLKAENEKLISYTRTTMDRIRGMVRKIRTMSEKEDSHTAVGKTLDTL